MEYTVSQQRRIILTSSLVVFSLGFFAEVERGGTVPSARFIIGVGMAFTICSIMVDLNSPMGAGFALLIMVSAIFNQGQDAFKLLNRRGGKTPTGSSSNRKRRTNRGRLRPGGQAKTVADPLEVGQLEPLDYN